MKINVGFRLEPGQSREITVTTAKPASTISARDLVNYEEAAEILGLSLQTVRIYKIKDPDFPEPITDTRSPVWRRADIVAYKERRASKRSLSDAAAAKRARSESGRKPKPAASEIDFSQLVSVDDIAPILGVTTQTVRKYRHNDREFPEPFYVKKTHWWRREDVLAYKELRAARSAAAGEQVNDADADAPV
jgi:predicted DNA-binding transcriptional regulator AlpA